MTEKQIQNEILRVLGSCPDVRLWRANTGVATFGDRRVAYGLKGSADLTGILQGGRRIDIEVKGPGGRLSKEQVAFGDTMTRMGGVYCVARCVEDAVRAVEGATRWKSLSEQSDTESPTDGR